MADFGSPVAQNVNPNAGIQTLQSILGIKQAQQNLETGLATQQSAQAKAQEDQQTAGQRKNLAAFFSTFDPSKHVGSDGTLDLDSVLTDPKLQQAAGDQFPALMEQMVKVKTAQLGAKQQLAQLNGTLRDQFADSVASLRTDPDVINDTPAGREKVKQAMANFAESGGPDASRVADIYSGVAQNAPPQKLAQTLSNFQLQAMDASAQASHQAPTLVDTGEKIDNVNPQAAGGNLSGSGPMRKGVAPAREPFTDQFGRVFTFNPQTGNYEPAASGGSGGASSSGHGNGPGAAAPGEVDAIKGQTEANFTNVNANRNAARIAPQQLDQIDKALTLSQNTNTGGDWTSKRALIESNLSSLIPGLKTAKDDASKVQELDKFLTRITRDSNQVLGGNAATDAEREQISKTNASTGYTPPAIQKVLTYAKAQTLAMQAKGDAQENWLKQQGNGITNQQNFETAWRQAYDPVLFQLQAAKPEDRKGIIANLPPEEAGRLAKQKELLKQLGVQ
jgi:hypothetical protein